MFFFNVQPGINLSYATGESSQIQEEKEDTSSRVTKNEEKKAETKPSQAPKKTLSLILNLNTKKAHLPGCRAIKQMKESNKSSFTGTPEELINKGYSACGICHPW